MNKIHYLSILKVGENRNGRIYSESSIQKIVDDFSNSENSWLCVELEDGMREDVVSLDSVLHIARDILYIDDSLILGIEPIMPKAIRMVETEIELKKNNIPSALVFTPMLVNVKTVDQIITDFQLIGFSVSLDRRMLENIFNTGHK